MLVKNRVCMVICIYAYMYVFKQHQVVFLVNLLTEWMDWSSSMGKLETILEQYLQYWTVIKTE